jgi:hypothetical protein
MTGSRFDHTDLAALVRGEGASPFGVTVNCLVPSLP